MTVRVVYMAQGSILPTWVSNLLLGFRDISVILQTSRKALWRSGWGFKAGVWAQLSVIEHRVVRLREIRCVVCDILRPWRFGPYRSLIENAGVVCGAYREVYPLKHAQLVANQTRRIKLSTCRFCDILSVSRPISDIISHCTIIW
jgi:hypothetical protein